MFNSLIEAKRFMEEKSVKMVDFMMVDLDGRWRHLTIPADRFTEDTFKSGIGFDGSNYGFAPVNTRSSVFYTGSFHRLSRSFYGNPYPGNDWRRIRNRLSGKQAF